MYNKHEKGRNNREFNNLSPDYFQIQQFTFLEELKKACKKNNKDALLKILKDPNFKQYIYDIECNKIYISYQDILWKVLWSKYNSYTNIDIAIPLLMYAKCLPFKNPQASYDLAIKDRQFDVASLVLNVTNQKKIKLEEKRGAKGFTPKEIELYTITPNKDIWDIYQTIELDILREYQFNSYFDYCKSRFMYKELQEKMTPIVKEILLCSKDDAWLPNEVINIIAPYVVCESKREFGLFSRMDQVNLELEKVINEKFRESLEKEGIKLEYTSDLGENLGEAKKKSKQKCVVM